VLGQLIDAVMERRLNQRRRSQGEQGTAVAPFAY